MLLRVCESLRERLLNEPEFGMGYQIATIVDNGRYVTMNAELAVPLPVEPKAGAVLPIKLVNEDTEYLTAGARVQSAYEEIQAQLDSLEALVASDDTVLEVQQHGSYVSAARPGEDFVRYSAFSNDARINADGSVQRGSAIARRTSPDRDRRHCGD